MRPILALLLVPSLAGPALAIDGVLEVNQACALSTGCFAGDGPGFPVTLSQPGSYRLTSNLSNPDLNADGLLVTAADVQVDLNGFTIAGPCAPTLCAGGGAGRGILVLGDRDNIRIHNGVIKHNAREGIKAADPGASDTSVEKVSVIANQLVGIWINSGVIRNSIISFNGGDGVRVSSGDGSLVLESSVRSNGADGISTGPGVTVSGNTAALNGGMGIITSTGSTISGNTVYQNGDAGITTIRGSTVSGNTVLQNAGNGIQTAEGCTVARNTVRLNGGGISLGADSTYRENTITSSVSYEVSGLGVNMGDNYCAGPAAVLPSCP
jgi:parallel beta-helix repeat protein